MSLTLSLQKALLEHVSLRGAKVFELGDQHTWMDGQRALAKDWYARQGATHYVCVDGNGNGDLLHDLNDPVPAASGLYGSFDLTTDFGTGEHVWNQDQCWRTLHDLCSPGGYISFARPFRGYDGHCLYLTQPAAIAALCHANGYELTWYAHALIKRGELMYGIMRKPPEAREFETPQQGRYFDHLKILTPEQRARGADYDDERLLTAGAASTKRKFHAPLIIDERVNRDQPIVAVSRKAAKARAWAEEKKRRKKR